MDVPDNAKDCQTGNQIPLKIFRLLMFRFTAILLKFLSLLIYGVKLWLIRIYLLDSATLTNDQKVSLNQTIVKMRCMLLEKTHKLKVAVTVIA
jgi:hypothetical protein